MTEFKHPSAFYVVVGLPFAAALILLRPVLWGFLLIGWIAKILNEFPENWRRRVHMSTLITEMEIEALKGGKP